MVRSCATTTLPKKPTPSREACPASHTARSACSRAAWGSVPAANSCRSARTASARARTARGMAEGTCSSSSISVTDRRMRVPLLRIDRSMGSAARAYWLSGLRRRCQCSGDKVVASRAPSTASLRACNSSLFCRSRSRARRAASAWRPDRAAGGGVELVGQQVQRRTGGTVDHPQRVQGQQHRGDQQRHAATDERIDEAGHLQVSHRRAEGGDQHPRWPPPATPPRHCHRGRSTRGWPAPPPGPVAMPLCRPEAAGRRR